MGTVAAVSVMLATTVALLMQLDAPWWAAISGYMSLMSTGAGSVRRGVLRLSGTIAGAVLGFVMARWLPYDQVALCLFLGCATMAGVIAVQVSPHGLAWLFMSITSSLVLLMSLNDPTQAFEIACYRTLDVAVGVSCAMVTANVLQDWHAEPPPTAPGWRHLLGAQWPSVLHGLRAAISVVTVTDRLGDGRPAGRGRDGGHDRRRDGRAADRRRRRRHHPASGGREVVPSLHRLPAGRHRGTCLPRAAGRVVLLVARHDRRRRVGGHAHPDGPARYPLCRHAVRVRLRRHDGAGLAPPPASCRASTASPASPAASAS